MCTSSCFLFTSFYFCTTNVSCTLGSISADVWQGESPTWYMPGDCKLDVFKPVFTMQVWGLEWRLNHWDVLALLPVHIFIFGPQILDSRACATGNSPRMTHSKGPQAGGFFCRSSKDIKLFWIPCWYILTITRASRTLGNRLIADGYIYNLYAFMIYTRELWYCWWKKSCTSW